MTNLDPKAGYCVLINTFDVEPEKADELMEVLSRATEHGIRQHPGFVSANLHISLDKKSVANYAQWRSKDDLDAMLRNPGSQKHMKEAADLAKSFAPLLYTLVESHQPGE